jgi:hypothetical protein
LEEVGDFRVFDVGQEKREKEPSPAGGSVVEKRKLFKSFLHPLAACIISLFLPRSTLLEAFDASIQASTRLKRSLKQSGPCRKNKTHSFPNRPRRLVRGEDAPPGPDELGGVLYQLGRVLGGRCIAGEVHIGIESKGKESGSESGRIEKKSAG